MEKLVEREKKKKKETHSNEYCSGRRQQNLGINNLWCTILKCSRFCLIFTFDFNSLLLYYSIPKCS